jgi:hypothetical protein
MPWQAIEQLAAAFQVAATLWLRSLPESVDPESLNHARGGEAPNRFGFALIDPNPTIPSQQKSAGYNRLGRQRKKFETDGWFQFLASRRGIRI